MLRSVRVPRELVALMQLQRATTREVGAPLYLPALEMEILDADFRFESEDDVDHGVEAGGLTIGGDEDDDFY